LPRRPLLAELNHWLPKPVRYYALDVDAHELGKSLRSVQEWLNGIVLDRIQIGGGLNGTYETPRPGFLVVRIFRVMEYPPV